MREHEENLTPMMKQYWAAKKTLEPDHLLLFRLGDFYEMFYDDAVLASALLEITLTKRGTIPMCGVPVHTVENYIKKLLTLGKKVAICEQTSPVQKGTIVSRSIVEKITPGTISNSTYLDTAESNFLASVYFQEDKLAYAWMDVSTADVCVEVRPYTIENLRLFLAATSPRELLFPESQEDTLWLSKLKAEFSLYCTPQRDWVFSASEGERKLKKILKVESLKAFALEGQWLEISALCALLSYIENTGKHTLEQITSVKRVKSSDTLEVDADAFYNLEILSSMREKSKKFSLLGILDQSCTAMGARKIIEWLSFPLKNKEKIDARQDKVAELNDNDTLRNEISFCLTKIIDIPRLTTRITLNKAHSKDVVAMRSSLKASLQIMSLTEKKEGEIETLIGTLFHKVSFDKVQSICDLLEHAIEDSPPVQIGHGDIIRSSYDDELNRLRTLHLNQKDIIDEYVAKEQQLVSFVLKLKLKYNNAIGYFFELTHAQRVNCPKHFLLRQSLTNTDRYKTAELADLETEIINAEHMLLKHEQFLFNKVCLILKESATLIRILSEALAELDVYVGLASLVKEHNYCKPVLSNDDEVHIVEGRHPVIEQHHTQGEFISNNLYLKKDDTNFVMLTGPNMSGKSTYLRQNALIVLMAQIGSFVPAREAKIGIRDKIFCRVGASDNLVKGESTFLVEMSETAYILQQATSKSLIIMDEIGRGTSVLDGESIAQAVAEFFLEHQIPTLFATHYHNLTDLPHESMKNFTLSIEREKEDIIFTRHITEGAVRNSYGIEVAKLAGIPDRVLERARLLLKQHVQAAQGGAAQEDLVQMSLGIDRGLERINNEMKYIIEEYNDIDVNAITPLEALRLLSDLQKKISHAHFF